MSRFSPQFYNRKQQQLPFTDSDGLYDFPSSDGKGKSTRPQHSKKSSIKKRHRKSSRSGGNYYRWTRFGFFPARFDKNSCFCFIKSSFDHLFAARKSSKIANE